MQDNFYGGAFVVLPKDDEFQISCSVVEGSEKNNIRLRESSMLSLAQEGEKGYETLLMHARIFAERLIALQEGTTPIHITCGVAESVDSRRILEEKIPINLSPNITSSEVIKVMKYYRTPLIRPSLLKQLQSQNESLPSFERDFFASIIRDIFETFPSKTELEVDKREYESNVSTVDELGLSDDIDCLMLEKFLGQEDVNLVDQFLSEINETDSIIPVEVVSSTKRLAKKFGEILERQLSGEQETGDFVQRFLPICLEGDIRNEIFRDHYLKRIFMETFLDELGIHHNICMKPTWEQRNPPFSDVVATFLADKMDKRDGTLPSAVGINHGEEYT